LSKLVRSSVIYTGKLGRYSVHNNGVTITLPMDVVGTRTQVVFEANRERINALRDELSDLISILDKPDQAERR
jgi:hypothetical protein